MKYLVLIFISLSVFLDINCQDTVSVTYLKNRSGTIAKKGKGYYVEYCVRENDSIVKVYVYSTKTKQLVKKGTKKSGIRVGKWTYYYEDGTFEKNILYDFPDQYAGLKYDYQLIDQYTDSAYRSNGLVFEDAKFPNGDFQSFIQKSMNYPIDAAEMRIQGKVIVRYLLDENGNVADVYIKKRQHPILEEECIRVVKSSPKWIPAKHNKKPIKISYDVPLVFQLIKE